MYLIHDAARPNFTLKVIAGQALFKELKNNDCVVPVLSNESDSVKLKEIKIKLINIKQKQYLFNSNTSSISNIRKSYKSTKTIKVQKLPMMLIYLLQARIKKLN